MPDNTTEIIDHLSSEISSNVGNNQEEELNTIASTFNKALWDALKAFNSSTFDDNGFVKKLKDLDIGEQKDKDLVKNVLNNLRNEFIDVQSINESELLLRRDIYNICTQMPEMRDVIYVVRDAIIECNVSTGEVSRSITFENHETNESLESQCKDIEKRYDLLMAMKNFIIPRTLMGGEMYIHVSSYAKLFAELEAAKEFKYNKGKMNVNREFKESVPQHIMKGFVETQSLYNDNNLKILMESISTNTKVDSMDTFKMEKNSMFQPIKPDNISKEYLSALLQNIHICNGSSVMMEELGIQGFQELLFEEYKKSTETPNKDSFFEANLRPYKGLFGNVPEDQINFNKYEKIKGCYVKYLNPLRMVPIRIDRKVIGYYYISTTMDLQINPAQPNGIVDLSFQHYTRDKNLVDNLTSIIIKSFDKQMLEKNIKLKNEIAEIVMAHRFSEGRLSFIFIPENEVIRLLINEDEEGKGHSILEPTLFPARMYLMLTLYNMIYTLNNNTTRVHYLKSSGLNKDYAAQIQRTMRKFQSRRITIDDIYSYSGVLNKIGGMGEMVLPSGRGDYKAIETDTIEAVNNPISIEFLEQQRRQAISGTGVPHLLVINAIDEVDFAKTLEMANTRFLSTVSAYKIDFNRGLTKFYQMLLKYSTEMEDDIIQSFRFQFNQVKQQDLVITNDMITNFNAMVEMVGAIYFPQDKLQDKDGKPTPLQMYLRRELAKEYLPQLNFDTLEETIKRVNLSAKSDALQTKVDSLTITDENIEELNNKEETS
jgi:hypothetical protein